MKKRILWFVVDLTIAAMIVLTEWIAGYKLPQKGIRAATFPQVVNERASERDTSTDQEIKEEEVQSDFQQSAYGITDDQDWSNNFTDISMIEEPADQQAEEGAETEDQESPAEEGAETEDQEIPAETGETETQSDSQQRTSVVMDTQDWHQKFSDKFTDTVIATDTSYSSPDLSIQLSYHHYDTGKMDLSESGKHKEYGTQVSYVLADIYVGDITCFRTAFAQDTYGVGYSEKLSDMSDAMRAVLAVNGDSYSNNRHKDNGTIIRNGVVYRSSPTDMETCVLNWDGTMDIYSPDQIDLQRLIEKGAYQSWIFGPSLLDENGRAKPAASLLTWDYIRESHPRTAIGYYEPGHYCILLVDGRQKTSRGMFPEEMAKVFEDLGCRAAYNLDGGHSSFMTFQGQTANHPYKSEKEVSDGIFFTEEL